MGIFRRVSERGKYNTHAQQRTIVGNIVLSVTVPFGFKQSFTNCV